MKDLTKLLKELKISFQDLRIKRPIGKIHGLKALSVLSLLVLNYSCKEIKKPGVNIEYYDDFSLVTNRGISKLESVDITENRSCVAILYYDSLPVKIGLINFEKKFIDTIDIYKHNRGIVYRANYKTRQGTFGSEYFIFQDSMIKSYRFGQPRADEFGPIETYLNIYSRDSQSTVFFDALQADTLDFMDKIFIFDSCCVKNIYRYSKYFNETKYFSLKELFNHR